MKNTLLLTDFSVKSLAPIHEIIKKSGDQKLAIQVVHILNLPTGISDLLSLRENKLYKSIPGNFIEAFQMVCNKYRSTLDKLEFKFVYCDTSRYFNNYVEGNNIEEVYLLDGYHYKEAFSQSADFTTFLAKCKVPVTKIQLNTERVSEFQGLSVLLNESEEYNQSANTRMSKQTVSY